MDEETQTEAPVLEVSEAESKGLKWARKLETKRGRRQVNKFIESFGRHLEMRAVEGNAREDFR